MYMFESNNDECRTQSETEMKKVREEKKRSHCLFHKFEKCDMEVVINGAPHWKYVLLFLNSVFENCGRCGYVG